MSDVPPQMTDENCGNCRFWRHRATQDLQDGQGERERGHCRRRPPRVFVVEFETETRFPFIAADEWCGKHEPTREKLRADARLGEISREAGRLLDAARVAVKGEAEADLEAEGRDEAWPMAPIDWRSPVAAIGRRIGRRTPELELEIWSLARARAGSDPKLVDMLNWAALDTTLAEASAS